MSESRGRRPSERLRRGLSPRRVLLHPVERAPVVAHLLLSLRAAPRPRRDRSPDAALVEGIAAFCVPCTESVLRVGFDRLRATARALEEAGRCEAYTGRCSNCEQSRLVFRRAGPPAAPQEMSSVPFLKVLKVVRALGEAAGRLQCDACMALRAGLRVDEARSAILELDGLAGFERRHGACGSCDRTRRVTAVGRARKLVAPTSGTRAPEPGAYRSACCGDGLTMESGAALPRCGRCGQLTSWIRQGGRAA